MEKLCVQFDPKPKATIGFVSIPSDITLDMEASPLLSQIPGVLWRFTKMMFDEGDDEICEEIYSRAKKNISNATKSFLPNDGTSYGSIDVVAMCCTSLSFTLGPEAVQSELRKGCPTAKVATDMASAVVDAIKTVCKVAKNSKRPRIALLTPYITPVHQRNIEYLNENGIDVVSEYNLGFKADKETTSMSPESIFEHMKCLSKLSSNIDAVFIGCSAFRATGYGFIDQLEEEIGKPVITSNQAMIWYCLKLSENITADDLIAVKGYGELFTNFT